MTVTSIEELWIIILVVNVMKKKLILTPLSVVDVQASTWVNSLERKGESSEPELRSTTNCSFYFPH